MKTDADIAEIFEGTPDRLGNADAKARPVSAARGLSALAEEMVYRLPGCTELEIRKALQRSARDFCERTYCWQEPAEIPAEPNEMGAYPFTVMAGAVVLNVRENRSWFIRWGARGSINGSDIDSSGWCGIPGAHPSFFCTPSRPAPQFLSLRNPRPVFAMAPEVGSEALPEEIVMRHGAAFVSGAMAELCMMTGRPWSDPSIAALEARQYNTAVGEATAATIRDLARPGVGLTCRGTTPFI